MLLTRLHSKYAHKTKNPQVFPAGIFVRSILTLTELLFLTSGT